jgi:N-acetylmuramoyl-L-alanine amidase
MMVAGVALGVIALLAVGGWAVSSALGAPSAPASAKVAVVTPSVAATRTTPPAAAADASANAATADVSAPAAPSVAATKTPAAKKQATTSSTKTAAATSTKPTAASKTAGFVVVIDAGHQAHADNRLEPIGPGSSTKKPAVASGTAGVVTHIHESVINLRVALKLRDVLKAAGIKVIMVRTSENVDIPNSKRAAIANNAHAGLFIRLHCDGVNSSSTHGFLTLVPAKNKWTGPILSASARAGRDVQKAALAATGAFDRGITPRSDMSGFNWSKVPSVIVEMGLMTNPTEDRKLATASYEQTLAQGIANGVLAYAAGK